MKNFKKLMSLFLAVLMLCSAMTGLSVITVFADEETRRNRLKSERKYSDAKIDSIFASQMKDTEFRKHCRFVIDTSGSVEATALQLENKLEEYKLL